MIPDIVAELHPPRLPAEFTSPGWPDLLAAFGLGLLLAALVVALVAPILRPRPRRETPAMALARLRDLPPAQRQLGQLRLLAAAGTPLPDDLRAALYGPTPPDPERLDALIRGARQHA
jgi:hypothetical protein